MKSSRAALFFGAAALTVGCSRPAAVSEDAPQGSDPGTRSASGPLGTPQTVKLANGTNLSLPAGTKLLKEQTPPDNLVSASIYQLPGVDGLLGINLARPTGAPCKEMLEAHRAHTEKAREDPATKALLRVDVIEMRELAGSPTLYTEIASRAAEEASANKPHHPGVGYVICAKDSWINLSVTLLKGEMTSKVRDLIKDIALSGIKPAS